MPRNRWEFNPEAFFSDRRTKIIWKDANGHVWHLSGYGQGREGAELSPEPSGMYQLDMEMLWTESARQDGASYEGHVIQRREIDWGISIAGSNIRDYHLINNKWWDGWDPDNPGVLMFFTPETGWRWAEARYVGNVEPKWGKDPALIKACDYDMTLSIDGSVYTSAKEFGHWRNTAGGASGSGHLIIQNPGHQTVFPTYTMPGPGTYSISDGEGGEMIPLPKVKAGQTLKVYTHNKNLVCRIYDPTTGLDGRTAWTGFGTKRFRTGLGKGIHKIKVSVTGGNVNSQVFAELKPRYFRPF